MKRIGSVAECRDIWYPRCVVSIHKPMADKMSNYLKNLTHGAIGSLWNCATFFLRIMLCFFILLYFILDFIIFYFFNNNNKIKFYV